MVKTSYIEVIRELEKSLKFLVTQDLGDPEIRHKCASAMYNAYYQISDPLEKDLAHKIMNDGSNLESETVLEIDHSMYDQDLIDFKNTVEEIIKYLNEIEPK